MIKLQSLPVPLSEDEDGVLRVSGTRISLDVVIHQYQLGSSPEAIALAFPSLNLRDIYATITFYLEHREEVDAYLINEKRREERVQREIDARNGTESIRERLLRRQGKFGNGH